MNEGTSTSVPPCTVALVVPVFNEAPSLAELAERIQSHLPAAVSRWELWLIDDGSTDESWDTIQKLSGPRGTGHIFGLKLRRNFGKAAALQAGFHRAQGDWIFTLDADLQDDPREIPRFLALMNQGYDVVSGWKQVRHDPWHKVFPSRVFNGLVSWWTGVKLHDHNCGFKCYRVEVFKQIRLYGELHRMVPVLAASRGFRVTELAVQHHPRKFGRSKYGWQRFLKGFLDLVQVRFVTAYGRRPMHFFGTLATVSLFVAGLGFVLLFVGSFAAWPTLSFGGGFLCGLGWLSAVQWLGFGFLAELLIRHQLTDDAIYDLEAKTSNAEPRA